MQVNQRSAGVALGNLFDTTAFGAAVIFGFRHGFDWDHLAALTDLTGSQQTSRRSMWLATLYAAGHAIMILLLGVAAIVFAARVPAWVDNVMERVAGVTLLGLGAWIIWTAATTRAAPPVRSRWMLAISGGRRLVSRWDHRDEITIEHSHSHDHHRPIHTHRHIPADTPAPTRQVLVAHSHPHRHIAAVPADPFMAYDSWSSFGIGMLHGIGAETPTQLLLFAAAAHASGTPTSVALLGCFVLGLVTANTIVAASSTLGYRSVLRHRFAMGAIAVLTACISITIGMAFVLGKSHLLPAIVTP